MPQSVGYPAESITKSHTDRVRTLMELLENGRTIRQSGREKMWKRSETQWAGKLWESADDPTSDLINVNISFSTVNTILPHITGREPVFMVEPLSKNATPLNARVQEAWLNRKWRDQTVGAQRALKKAAWDYVVYGDGFLKVTWQIVDRPVDVDMTATVVEEHVDQVSPWDVWIDPVSDEGIEKARWVALRYWLTEEEARADTSLKIPGGYEFTVQDPTDTDDGRKQKDLTAQVVKWVEMYEMYDQVDRTMYVVPKDGEKPWKVIEGIDLPLVQLANHNIPMSPYHMGDLEQIYDVQRELDKTRSQQMTHRRRNIAKVFVREDALTTEGKAAISSSVVGEFVPVKGEDVPLSDLVSPMQLPPLAAETYAMSDTAKNDAYDMTGISEYQRGSSPDITRTATEAQIMQGSSNIKLEDKLNDIEQGIRKVGEILLAVARDVYPETDVDEMAMFISGVDARQINEQQAGLEAKAALDAGDDVRAEAIAATSSLYGETVVRPDASLFEGTYQVLVEHASTDAMNPQAKADKYRRILNMLMEVQPVAQMAGINIDIAQVLRMWLEAEGFPGVDSILRTGSPQPGLPGAQGPVPGAPVPAPAAPSIGASGMADLEALLSQLPQGAGPVGPDNSGSLDPDAYPIVGT